ncbi:MAG: hypothetical protein WA708_17890 [Acidobacteriaceae bacterium]
MNVPGSPPIGISDRIGRPPVAPERAGAEWRGVRSPWIWWHLLSLDAPTVAVVWCWFFAAVFGVSLPWVALPTLALGTWCVYVADRLLDGWRSADTIALRDRHWFYLRHRKLFVIAWTIAAVPLAWLIFFRVSQAIRVDDVVLCLIGVAYFLLIHGQPSTSGWVSSVSKWLTKELAVGFLFPIATAIPTWTRLTARHDWLAAAVVTFGAVCWLNCVAIQTWEDEDASQEVIHTILSGGPRCRTAPAFGMTEFLGRHLSAFAAIVAALGVALAFATAHDRLWPLFASVALSGVLFLLLIRNRQRFSTLVMRIAADAALLTPLLFLFGGR